MPDLTTGGSLCLAVVFARARTAARIDRPADENFRARNRCIGNSSPESFLVARKDAGKKVADARLITCINASHQYCRELQPK